ncbi:Phosphoglycerate kinase [Nosema granulosis]|uniref:Phosphoglycerate kinase n=1 Tax=Nosema granulosis TaxID=83296 RepID=A0A9P6H1G8_9MICR|nr:Phosphoglycerate kinase [Nosema granulosis]
MKIKDFHKADLKNKNVFLRMDYNVPIQDNKILDTYKITSSFSTIVDVYKKKPRSIVIGTHLGRPKGEFNKDFSVFPIFCELKKMITNAFGENLVFCGYDGYRDSKFAMIENLRFYSEEENNYALDSHNSDMENKHLLSNFFEDNIDVVVVDAFGSLHRDSYSINRTNKPTYAGNLVLKEVKVASKIVSSNIDLIILGGCKVSDKIPILRSLISKCKSIFIVGGLAYTFMKFHSRKEIGRSVFSEESKEDVKQIYKLAKENNIEIFLPEDFVIQVGDDVILRKDIPADGVAYDIGPLTIGNLRNVVGKHKSIFWNGTPGVFEKEEYSHGSEELVNILAGHRKYGRVVVGGGESSACVKKYSSSDKFHFVSTGGGAFLKFLSGEEMPGLNILKE